MILARQLNQAVRKSKRKLKREAKTFEFKEFGEKALDVLDHADAPYNILHGAVRSGKTITSTIKWLEFVNKSPHEEFMQSGKTRTSLYRNVLRDELAMLESFGVDYEHRASDGYLRIEDNYIWLVGFAHEGISDIIRGMTIAGWYADETNVYPKLTVEEALDRLSLSGSRVYWTMNPDSPYHYINTDYIQNNELLKAGDLKTWHFTLWDNPNLPQEYIDRTLRRYPKGSIGYKRKVLGLWVVAEGIIYNQFNEDRHTFTEVPFAEYEYEYTKEGEPIPILKKLNYDYYTIGTDWGSGNVTVFGLMGTKRTNEGNHYHLLDEFYFDAQDHPRGIKASEAVDSALEMLNYEGIELPLRKFITSHEASTLRNELADRDYLDEPVPYDKYTPETLEDIYSIQEIIADNRFMINANKCPNTLNCMYSYAWDPKAQARGEDKPLKKGDHPADMIRGPILYFTKPAKKSMGLRVIQL